MSGPAGERRSCRNGVVMGTIGKVAVIIVVVVCAVAGGAPAVARDDPSSVANATIPAPFLSLFQQPSAANSCGVSWTLLAAVAHTESDFDPSVTSSAGAEGLFQFEPTTFAAYDRPTPTGGAVPPSPFDPTDAAYADARYLCSLGIVANPTSALVAYNCGNPGPACQAASAGYAAQVLATAASYRHLEAQRLAPSRPGPRQVCPRPSRRRPSPTPNHRSAGLMSGAAPAKSGFDCSGLVVWSYGLAGVVVPRVANDQWHDEPHVAMDQLGPGDLIFFGTGDYADHVGIYVGGSAMVDAPHTGADVRIDTIPMSVGAAWGSQVVLGAADPVSQPATT
jgi:cell wall-associated NlpC family hydrolase